MVSRKVEGDEMLPAAVGKPASARNRTIARGRTSL